MSKRLLRVACAVGSVAFLTQAAGASLIPSWQQKWSTTVVSGMAEPLAARELSDGSTMVIGTGVAAVRYDANGSVLSAVAFSPPEFVPFAFSTPFSPPASVIAIDPSGMVFISSPSTRETSEGDVWVTAYDGRTGESLWAAPAVFSQVQSKSVPGPIVVGADGDPVVFCTAGGSHVLAGKLDRTSGQILWEVSLAGSSPRAVVDLADDVILGMTGEPPSGGNSYEAVTYKLRSADGGISWGPVAVDPGVSNAFVLDLAMTSSGDFFGAIYGSSGFLAKYSGATGGEVWGPVIGPGGLRKVEATPAGNLVALSEVSGTFTLTEYDGGDGSVLWTSVPQAEQLMATIRVAADGSVFASTRTGSSSPPSVGTWKFSASTGEVVWGPLAVPSATLNQSRTPVLLVRSDGSVFGAALFPQDLGAYERDPATGAVLWGPTGFSASFPIDGTMTDMTQGPDGGIYVTGYAGFPGVGYRWVTLKYSRADGSVVWGPVYQTFQSFSEPYNVRTDSNGNAFVIGYDPDTSHETIVKYASADGSVLWTSTPSGAQPIMMAVDSNGDVAVTGWTTVAETDFSTTKVSGASGSTLWGPVTYVRAPGHNAFASAIAVTPGGDFVVSGYTIVALPDPNEWVTLKYSGTTGALLWGPALLGDSSISGNYVQDLQVGADGGVVVAGSSIVNEAQRMTTIKYDGSTGSPVWGPVLAAEPADPYGQANAAAIDSAGNVFVTGYVYNGRSFDFGTFKYRGTDGAVLWGPVLFDGPAGGSDFANAIAIDGTGNPVVGGVSGNIFKINDIVTVEYDGATGAQKGAPATLGGFPGHDLPRHNLVASGSSIVLAGTSDTFLTVAYNESDSLFCDPNAPAPVASVSSGPVCAGQTVQLTASAYPGATYNWTGPNGFASSLPNPTLVATAAFAGAYSVVIQAYGCTLPTATTQLLVHPPISAAITLDTATLTASVPDAGAGAGYAWLVDNGVIASGSGTRSITLSLGAGDPVTVRVDVSNASGCTATQTVPVFFDIPAGYWAASQIAKLINDGVSAGCGSHDFCPDSSVTRAQMAIFLLRAKNGRSYNPPAATGSVFTDVPASSFAAAWIEALAASGVTSGCGGGNYCPSESVTRAQIAVFLLRTLHGAAFVPPPATGTVFSDVPASAFAAAWIERLSAEGLTAGCGGGAYCPDATVSRAQMAVLLVQTFQLP